MSTDVTYDSVYTDHNVSRESRAEADSNRGPSAYQPNALPLGQTGSLRVFSPGSTLHSEPSIGFNLHDYVRSLLGYVHEVILPMAPGAHYERG